MKDTTVLVKKKISLAFLASGRGSNMIKVIEACESGEIDAIPAITIVSNANAEAFIKASEHNIPSFVVDRKAYKTEQDCDKAILALLKEYAVDLLLLVGYLGKVGEPVVAKYFGRIINIHPSLLPKYGGKGMYGMRVHEAVMEAKDTISGATVHLVNNEYDKGEILYQKQVDISVLDTAQDVAQKVLQIEHEILIETLKKITDGTLNLSPMKINQN